MEDKDGFGDWRIQAVTTLAADLPAAYPGGQSHKAGAPVYLTAAARHPQHNVFAFVMPSPTALALDLAMGAAAAARNLMTRLTILKSVATFAGRGKTVTQNDLPILYDLFEQSMLTVTFSYQSLETFSNWTIANTLKEKFVLKRKKGTTTLSAEELERVASTEEKIGKVLPNTLSIKTPSGTKLWERFLLLQQARDNTIHLKSQDAYTKSLDKESFFFTLLTADPLQYPIIALDVIEYFSPAPGPRWLRLARQKVALSATVPWVTPQHSKLGSSPRIYVS